MQVGSGRLIVEAEGHQRHRVHDLEAEAVGETEAIQLAVPRRQEVSRSVGEKQERPVGEVEPALHCACSKQILK